MNKSRLLHYALDAASRGLRVLPLKPKDKLPETSFVPHAAKEATTDPAIIRDWWGKNPDCNIGVNAGVVVDCDTGISNLDDARTWTKIVGLPETLIVRTGRRV